MKYNKELLDRFLTEKVAIALRTQEEWNEFMELLEKETDLGWGTEMKPTEFDGWEYCESRTSVTNDFNGDGLEYASCKFYEGKGYTVIEFKELVKEKEMNLADKLRFLADRWEDGKDFYMGRGKYSLNSGKLVLLPSGINGEIEINDLKGLNLKLAPQWTFTEDEKAILRNLPEKYKWIARDGDQDVLVCTNEPTKRSTYWSRSDMVNYNSLYLFQTLFQSIKWSDEEPCPFREYL